MEPSTGEYSENVNPADMRDIIGLFPSSGVADIDEAASAAENALPFWASQSVSKRAAMLYKVADWLDSHAEMIASDLTREEGKIYGEALNEVRRSAEHFRFYAAVGHLGGGSTYPADDPRVTLYTSRHPLGVIAIITPWNFPLSIPARKIAPALITGNTVIFKPASETPRTALYLMEAIESSGIPRGIVNCVVGPGSRIGDALVSHGRVRGVSFTGSTEAGFRIQRRVSPTVRLQLELGGKNALTVMDDADISRSVQLVVKGGYNLAGQACTGTSRVLVQETVYQAFLDELVEATTHLRVGDGRDAETQIGPLVNAKQKRQVLQYVDMGCKEGLKLLSGGEGLDSNSYQYGHFVTPAIFGSMPETSRLFQEEIFGPVLGVTPVKTLDDAITLTNASEYGLVASICTDSLSRAQEFAQRVEVGMVKVNRTTTGLAMNAPFGGWKNSSTASFREEGKEVLDFFTKEKTIFMGWELP